MIYIQLRFYISFAIGKLIKRLPSTGVYSKIKIKYVLWSLDVTYKTLEWKLKKEFRK